MFMLALLFEDFEWNYGVKFRENIFVLVKLTILYKISIAVIGILSHLSKHISTSILDFQGIINVTIKRTIFSRLSMSVVC